MKRQRQNDPHSKKKKQNQPKRMPASKKALSRRDFFNNLRNGAIATVIVGGGAWFVVDEVMATLDEQDLTKIGNGIPTIVQIHDPQCSQCIALQRETRRALENFGNDKLQYLVANIKSAEGRALAAAHGVQHVTLLLFDAKGKKRQVLAGPNQSGYLTDVFRQHLEKFGGR
ncbi:MAG: hypothetical protein JKY12_07245 [Sneathiella sp.]|nr:hypothetical protein [Sneathiella sp.]